MRAANSLDPWRQFIEMRQESPSLGPLVAALLEGQFRVPNDK